MAAAAACKVFQVHAWKKDLCANCMRARDLHKESTGPVPSQRTSRAKRGVPTVGSGGGRSSPQAGSGPDGAKRERIASKVTAENSKELCLNEDNKVVDGLVGFETPSDGAASQTGNAMAESAVFKNTEPKLPSERTKQRPKKVNAEGHEGRAEKPTIASKPQGTKDAPGAKAPDTKKKPATQSNIQEKENKPANSSKHVADQTSEGSSKIKSDKSLSSSGSGNPSTSTYSSSKTGSRPKVPPPKTPGGEAAGRSSPKATEQHPTGKYEKNKQSSSKIHIKGLSQKVEGKSVMDKTGGANSKTESESDSSKSGAKPVVPPSSSGGHYYHQYDVSKSLSRKMTEHAEFVDKRTKQLLADIALTPPYKVVDLSNQPAGHCRDSTCMPPSLPKTLPPLQDSMKPDSKCGTTASHSRLVSKGKSGSSGSIMDESLMDRRMPFILQEEAAKMREQSKTPPPIRKVPIMIPAREDTRLSHTYEPIEDPVALEVNTSNQTSQDMPEAGDPGSDFSDYSQTYFGCLSFTKHSKSRGASPAPASVTSESRMAALASLDLLKGIAGRVPSSPTEDVESGIQQSEVDIEAGPNAVISSLCTTGGSSNVNLKSGEAAKLRKSGRSFFKKLLKIGSKESSTSVAVLGSDAGSEESGGPIRLHLDTQRASGALSAGVINDHQSSSRSILSAQTASAGDDRQAIFVDVRNALSKRNASAPDICRELAVREFTADSGSWTGSPERDGSSTAGTSGSQTHLSHVDTGPAPVVAPGALMKKKPNLTTSTYSLCEGKINNIQQAEEMARSLGIDKVSSRNKSSLSVAPRLVPTTDAATQAEPSPVMTDVKTPGASETVKVDTRSGAISPTNKPATPAKPRKMTAAKTVDYQRPANKGGQSSNEPVSEEPHLRSTATQDTLPKQRNNLNEETLSQDQTNYGIISSRNVRPISPKPKPNIPVKPQKKPLDMMSVSANSITNNPAASEDIVTSPARSLPELSTADVEDEPASPTGEGSREEAVMSPSVSSCGEPREYDAVSPEPVSPTSEEPGISRAYRKSDVRASKVQRRRMPAPPPPPAEPTSPTPGSQGPPGLEPRTSAPGTQHQLPNYESRVSNPGTQSKLPNYESRTGIKPPARSTSVQGVRRPSGLRAEDISAPIILGEGTDVMSRSLCSPTGDRKTVDDLACAKRNPGKKDSLAKHSRNKTVADIDLSLISPDSDPQFDTQGRRSSKFLNRALPPTPAELTAATRDPKHKASRPSTTSLIQENEYELVSLDGDAEERVVAAGTSVERPEYEDIDSEDEVEEADGVYSDPMDLLRDPKTMGVSVDPGGTSSSDSNGSKSAMLDRGDDYLAPVSGSGDEDKPAPLPRIVGKRSPRIQHRSRNTGGSFYTNAEDDNGQKKPLLTINDGFSKMGLRNVQTLESRSLNIISNLLPQQSEFVADVRWSDFSLMRSLPVLEIGDVAVYEMRNVKVKPHDGFIMVSQRCLSRAFLSWRCSGVVAPSLMFQDRISTELFPRHTRGDKSHYHMTTTVETNLAVLGYSSMTSLDTWICDLDPVFTSDLTEYERKACLWISQIISAVLDLAEKSPRLDNLSPDHVVAVIVPSCSQCYPILLIPDVISSSPDPDEETTEVDIEMSSPNWVQISAGIINILFRLLRLDPKERTSPGSIPIRTKFSRGIQKFINKVTSVRRNDDPLRALVLGKLLMETMLWGPSVEESRSLLGSGSLEAAEEAFRIWLEVQRCSAVNELASGSFHNTPEFANMLWYWCSSSGQMLLDAAKLLYC